MDENYFKPKQLEIIQTVTNFIKEEKKVFSTSSFQTQSLPLLHILSLVEGFKKVYMTDTGFHFPETLAFAKKITSLLKLDLIILNSDVTKLQQLDNKGRFLYSSNPDVCLLNQ